jgi:hypothetical protein
LGLNSTGRSAQVFCPSFLMLTLPMGQRIVCYGNKKPPAKKHMRGEDI